jgi:Spy/CpxP family protein refolding chaperone
MKEVSVMKKKITVLATVFILTLTSVAAAGFHGDGAGMKHQWGKMNPAVLAALNLTAEQAEKVRSLRVSFMKDMAPLRTQQFERRAELQLLWMQIKADPAQIKGKQKEMFDLKWRMMEKVTDYRLKFRSILSEEQLSKFLALGGEKGFFNKKKKGHGRGYGQRKEMKGAQ